MFKKIIGDIKRWLHRTSIASLEFEPVSTDHDFFEPLSCFGLSLNHKTPLQGFYMLEVNSTHSFMGALSAFYYTGPPSALQSESSFSADNAFIFPLGSRKTVKRVVYFSGFADKFRWDINMQLVHAMQSDFKLSKITTGFTRVMLIKKLLSNGCLESDIKTLPVADLYVKYDGIFSAKSKRTIDYKSWMDSVEDFSAKIEKQNITFSVIMPVYNPSLEYLSAAIESVLAQTYTNWELCISDDCSPNNAVRELISEYVRKDTRIKAIFRKSNGNISAASNSALSIAIGDYVALLDHDDVLSPYALNEVALTLQSAPADIIYSDEDKIDENGKRYDPHFKSDFNIELILSHNYISHLGVYKKILIEKVGGFRLGYEGCQDYDLLLRCLPEVDYSAIKHIPKILYHWRAIAGSTAQDSGQKSYTGMAGLKALEDAVSLMNPDWKVIQADLPNTYTVNRLVMSEPLVSIIIPTKDQKELLKSCIDSILEKTSYKNYEIIIVDNGSVESKTRQYFTTLSCHKNIRILDYPKPFNFSAINNYAVSQCQDSEFVLLLNNDVEVINTDWLAEMVSIAQQDDVGCVGAKLYYSNGFMQHAGVILGIGGVAGHSHKYFFRQDNGYFSRLKLRQDLSAVTAACLLVKKSVYTEVGGLNEEDLRA